MRIAESFARMQLQPVATEAHVRRALDLFTVSTMDAVKSGVMEAVVRATSLPFLPQYRGLKGSAGGLPLISMSYGHQHADLHKPECKAMHPARGTAG